MNRLHKYNKLKGHKNYRNKKIHNRLCLRRVQECCKYSKYLTKISRIAIKIKIERGKGTYKEDKYTNWIFYR